MGGNISSIHKVRRQFFIKRYLDNGIEWTIHDLFDDMPYLLSKPNLLSIFGDEVNDLIDDNASLFEKNGGIEKEIVLSFLCSGILPLDVIRRMPRMNKKNDFVHVPVRIIETKNDDVARLLIKKKIKR